MSQQIEQPSAAMRLAHVLFTDIVGYSKLPIDQQTKFLQTLQEIVRGTAEVSRAQAADQLITIATGDGMALVFFNDPMAPVQCALEISRALKGHPEIQLRMGVHSGPVDEIVDVNDRKNVAGSGINMAQRVMDSGDAGHILLSRRVAEDLGQYSSWQPFLHDLKEVEVKHGVRMHVFNLYTGEAGNAALPEKIRQQKKKSSRVPVIAILAGVVVVALVATVLIKKFTGSGSAVRPEAESTAVLQRKADAWTATIFSTQAGNGGLKGLPSGRETSTQVWTTAQGLTAVLSTGKNLDNYSPKIRAAFDYIEKSRRSTPAEGWNYYANAIPYTVTEINAWVTVAYVKSLDNTTKIWSDSERAEIVNRVLRDLNEIKRRQDANGGWRPIREQGPDFSRTYSTVTSLWALLEARRSPAVFERMGTGSDESIRTGLNWLLRSYKEGQGWVPNPNRTGQKGRFDGLTAHVLYVLSLAETVPDFAYLKSDQSYMTARKEFANHQDLAARSIEKDNSSIPDADTALEGTEFMGEGSTFLWFPWTLLALTQLSLDESLPQTDRDAAGKLRAEILSTNFPHLESYVESANLTYLCAENLFCVSQYLRAIEKR